MGQLEGGPRDGRRAEIGATGATAQLSLPAALETPGKNIQYLL